MRYFARHKITTIILVIVSILIYIGYTSVLEFEYENRTNKYYINKLYTSEQKTYKYYLDDNEKIAYDSLLETIKNKNKVINTEKVFENADNLQITSYYQQAEKALIIDHPEIVELLLINYETTSNNLKINLTYIDNNIFTEEINVFRIKKILNDLSRATIDMSDKEKIKYVYEWVHKNIKYDEKSNKSTIYNALIKKEANALGISKTVQIILSNIGVESSIVVGNTSKQHTWNIVRYNDEYYYFDATIEENKKIKYNGLNNDIFKEYKMENDSWYPSIINKNKLYK